MTLLDKLEYIRKYDTNAATHRIVAELRYAIELSEVYSLGFEELIDTALNTLISFVERDGTITKSAADQAEKLLLPMSKEAKKLKVHCVAHAHIDMNWLWGYNETVAVTVDTFRTMLDLMKEYPQFRFAQSQASTYKIIADYAPEMLPEIKARIREGRWEVSASSWVENDKNMPNGESLARQMLYTKRYLCDLLEIAPESLDLGFEPDTFGHNANLPEILAAGGVKYYYHCRGSEGDCVFNWKGKNAETVLVYRDPLWYDLNIDQSSVQNLPIFCEKYGIDCALMVYGVGDHGGGPTRRDVERLIEMQNYPVFPTVLFSSYHAFFGELERYKEQFPTKEGELNYIFTGCYTSQSEIKAGNRYAEARAFESEALSAFSTLYGGEDRSKSFEIAWQRVLFNQFHDIITGSCLPESKEFAMGEYQKAMAAMRTNATSAMKTLAAEIDTEDIGTSNDRYSTAEGAGAGYRSSIEKGGLRSSVCRQSGKKRIVHLFNATQYRYNGVCEILIWDWNYDTARAVFTDAFGNTARSDCIKTEEHYWGHVGKTFAVEVSVPAFGYATYLLDEESIGHLSRTLPSIGMRVEKRGDQPDIVLENACVKAVFDKQSMVLRTFTEKKSGKEVISTPSCFFMNITESPGGMTAWLMGERIGAENLNESSKVTVRAVRRGGVRQSIAYALSFGNGSEIAVTVTLDAGASLLNFETEIKFLECGNKERGVPQIRFMVSPSYPVKEYRYDIPFGSTDRENTAHDVPANSFGYAIPEEGAGVMLMTDSKYGFRGNEGELSVALLRGSYDPDLYPEYGDHRMQIAVGIPESGSEYALFQMRAHFIHKPSVCTATGNAKKGRLPKCGSFLETTGDVTVSAVKMAENGQNELVIRLYAGEKGGEYSLTLPLNVQNAYSCDLHENALEQMDFSGKTLRGTVHPFDLQTLRIAFEADDSMLNTHEG